MHQANHDNHNKNSNNNKSNNNNNNHNSNNDKNNNNNIDMSNCLSALRLTIYLCLTLLCLYICTFSSSNSVVQKFLDRPTTTKVSNHNASLDLEIYLAV